MPILKHFAVKLDGADYKAIQQAMAIRASGLFCLPDGSLAMPDGDSEEDGALLAEICRDWVEKLGQPLIQGVLDKAAARREKGSAWESTPSEGLAKPPKLDSLTSGSGENSIPSDTASDAELLRSTATRSPATSSSKTGRNSLSAVSA